MRGRVAIPPLCKRGALGLRRCNSCRTHMLSKSKLEKLYRSGLSIKEIADKQDWPYYAVKYWMEKYNIPRRSRVESSFYAYWNRHNSNGHNTPNRLIKRLSVEEVKDLYYKKGHSAKEVGRFFGRGESNIYRFMARNNLLRRSPAETNNIIYNKQDPYYFLKDRLNT